MKKIFKGRSKLLWGLTIVEGIISIIAILSFVYSDSLSYSDSLVFKSIGVEKLLESIYSSTFWALILLLIALVTIFSLACLIYKKMEFQFISICLLFVLLILAINLKNSITSNIASALIFIPIIVMNIMAYYNQSYLNKKKKK